MTHQKTLLYSIPKNTTFVLLKSSQDPTSVVISTEGPSNRKLYWNGACIDVEHCQPWALNPRGDLLAMLRLTAPWDAATGTAIVDIYKFRDDFRGELQVAKTYELPINDVYAIAWINDDSLACQGWQGDNEQELLWFINDEHAPANFSFECYFGGNVLVKQENYQYTIDSYGNISSKVPRQNDDFFDNDDLFNRAHPIVSFTLSDDGSVNIARLTFKGMESPPLSFDVEGFRPDAGFQVNSSETEIAFVSNHLGLIRGFIEKSVNQVFNGYAGCAGILAWPMALIFNPYFGIGNFFLKFSHREKVGIWDLATNQLLIDHWPKCHYIITLRYLEQDLVAVAQVSSSKQSVIINGHLGPKFDYIGDLRLEKNKISYVGIDNQKVYRVVRTTS